jgi:GTP-binding protein
MNTVKNRMVAIVGRPNVGKSAIFNRLSGRRIAIVHEQSGVTRDRLIREITCGDSRFELVDTGGICNIDRASSEDEIESAVLAQAEAALNDAAVAMLVVDIEVGLTPLDEVVASILHERGVFTVIAANKSDNPERDNNCVEFEKFGFPVFPVSALHDRGFEEIMQPILDALPEIENPTLTEPLKVAVVGRPNVGKSSYINRLLRHERVIVSDVPGTTRDSIDIPFSVGQGEQARHYLLIDTAGMRRIGKIDSSVERFSRFRAEKSIAHADVVVLVLDETAGPTAQDKKIASLIQEHRKGIIIIVNKWDLSETTQTKYLPALLRAIPFMEYCPVVFLSSKSGFNIRKSVDAIDYVAAQVSKTLPTGILNRAVLDAYERLSPQSIQGKRLNILYCTQVGKEPIRIRLFVNDPRLVRPNYRRYLERKLRDKFGLEGAPVILEFRSRQRSDKRAGIGRS